MCAKQRKPVRMVFRGSQRNAPATDGMALLAIAPHLPAMEIRVTVGALFSDTGKHQLCVALTAIKAHVHSAKRIPGLSMVEIREGTNRFAACSGVTVPARDAQRSVRTGGLSRLSLLIRRSGFCRVQRVTAATFGAAGAAAQCWVFPALLILRETAMTIETPELRRFPFREVVTVVAVFRTGQESVLV